MSTSTNSSFNPYAQNFTILMANGVTPVTVSIPDLDSFFYYNMASCINYGTQMGACLLMFFVVACLTRESNRLKFISIINLLSLFFGFLRALFLALYFVSPWSETYASLTLDFSRVPRSAYATSVFGTIVPLLMTITVNMSLVYQAHTVCKNIHNRKQRYGITGMSTLVFLLAVGFRFAEAITNSIAIMAAGNYYVDAWIQTGTLVTETISIWFFSIIFTGKLLWTLYNRKRMGWKQWSAVRILAAMGGCTMTIPSIFAILEYVAPDNFPEAGTLALTMVALLLPLSSLWARMATDSETSTLNLSYLSDSKSSSSRKFGSQSTAPSSRLEFLTDRKGSLAPISPTTIDSRIEHVPAKAMRDSTEVDLEAMGVRVDRSYSVHSGKGLGGFGMD